MPLSLTYQNNWEPASFLKAASSFIFKVKNELKTSGGTYHLGPSEKKHCKLSDIINPESPGHCQPPP